MLSPCVRQVTHALLTRPPLGYQHFHSQQADHFTHHDSVRLACVKHAASVHPEPGSNSLKNICWSGSKQAWLLFNPEVNLVEIYLDYWLLVCTSSEIHSLLGILFRVALLFICQGTSEYVPSELTPVISDFHIISDEYLDVNGFRGNFLKFLA